MRKIILIVVIFLLQSILLKAQAPEKVSYQSIIRNATGELVRSKSVGILIIILQGSVGGAEVYVEKHTADTNENGLASIEIGNGNPVSGTFADIDWSDGPYFLKVETDPEGGTDYSITGTSEILSTPYSLYSKIAASVEDEEQTLADVLEQDNDGNAEQIKNIADPTDEQDAATKAYVDILLDEIEILKNLLGYDSFVDTRDSHEYKTKQIGSQVWMTENLVYLPSVSPPGDDSYTSPYYYVYGYTGSTVSDAKELTNYQTYGVLYNWQAATIACPTGWHLPSSAEWSVLTDFLTDNFYGYGGAGSDIGKSMAYTSGWDASGTDGNVGNDQASNNRSGFSGLPGGYRNYSDAFDFLGNFGGWWSSTDVSSTYATYIYLENGKNNVSTFNHPMEEGYSVRCIMD